MELAITTYNMNMDKSKDKTPRKDFGKKVSDISLGNNTQFLPWQIFLANFFAKYSSNPFQLLKAMK